MATSKKASFLQLKLHVYKLSLQLYIYDNLGRFVVQNCTVDILLIIIFPLNIFDLGTLSAPKMAKIANLV